MYFGSCRIDWKKARNTKDEPSTRKTWSPGPTGRGTWAGASARVSETGVGLAAAVMGGPYPDATSADSLVAAASARFAQGPPDREFDESIERNTGLFDPSLDLVDQLGR